MPLGEFEIIRRFFQPDLPGVGVELGIGDDCALLQLPAGCQLAVSVDTLVEGVHFPQDADPFQLAQRALCVSLSDLAAMAADPLWVSVCLTLPGSDVAWLSGFAAGLQHTLGRYQCALVGGDTTRGPLAVSVQVMGAVAPGAALRRSGAQPGDRVYVTGSLGDGAAALTVLAGHYAGTQVQADYLLERFYHPVPQFAAAAQLRGLASAAIDVSDGLTQDLGHICRASGVGALIAVEDLPLSPAVEVEPDPHQRWRWALCGGDDYCLCVCVPPERRDAVQALVEQGLLSAFCIGEITPGEAVICQLHGEPYALEQSGYQHFG